MVDKFFTCQFVDTKKIQSHIFESKNPRLPLAIVYALWDEPKYVDLLCLSIYSQLKYTDAARASIKIFCSSNIADAVAVNLKNRPVDIIKIEGDLRKYSAINHPSLSPYKQIVLCDCDTFFYSKTNVKLYEQLATNTDVLMLADPNSALDVFTSRKEISSFHERALWEYFSWFNEMGYSNLHSMLQKQEWFLSCLMSFPTKLYKEELWFTNCDKMLETEPSFGCDETAFLLHAWYNGYKVSDIADIKNVKTIYNGWTEQLLNKQMILDSPKTLYVIHPLHGTFASDARVGPIYDMISG